jgi:secreted Zn-dependent insulinase-like peptidase
MIATGIDVESVLRSFHHHHYLPNAMKLVVVGPQSLDELKANVLLAADGEWPTATSPLPV